MRSARLLAAWGLALALSACADPGPATVVGTWVLDVRGTLEEMQPFLAATGRDRLPGQHIDDYARWLQRMGETSLALEADGTAALALGDGDRDLALTWTRTGDRLTVRGERWKPETVEVLPSGRLLWRVTNLLSDEVRIVLRRR